MVRPIDLPARLCFIELSQLGSFISTVNQIRTYTMSGCKRSLAPVAVKCRGLGGAVTVRYSCDGCGLKGATFEAHSKCKTVLAGSNRTLKVSNMCVHGFFNYFQNIGYRLNGFCATNLDSINFTAIPRLLP